MILKDDVIIFWKHSLFSEKIKILKTDFPLSDVNSDSDRDHEF